MEFRYENVYCTLIYTLLLNPKDQLNGSSINCEAISNIPKSTIVEALSSKGQPWCLIIYVV